jgi:NAD(P)-dependent dehydrogenase (short-subunit alcohol dehydrogenase family)
MDLGLAGRVAVVTGSSQGIGRAAALLFGSEGARVAVTYHRERDRALAVVDEIENGGARLSPPSSASPQLARCPGQSARPSSAGARWTCW